LKTNENTLPLKPGTKYYKFFAIQKSNPDIKVCLQLGCGEKVKAPGTNRTNLRYHLMEKHKICIENQVSVDQSKISDFKVGILDSNSFEMIITKMVCLDFIPPYAIYSKDSFKILYFKSFNQIVTEDKLWKSINIVHDIINTLVQKKIGKCTEKPTITLDDWGCRNGREF
ncbi:MAG: hypothetical protein MHPSP_004799, partial [Paramarteilia canceri]